MALPEQSIPLEARKGMGRADKDHIEDVRRQMQREQEWLRDESRYKTNREIL